MIVKVSLQTKPLLNTTISQLKLTLISTTVMLCALEMLKGRERSTEMFPVFVDGSNACTASSCAQLCLLKKGGHSCACQDGFVVANDGRSCTCKIWTRNAGRN